MTIEAVAVAVFAILVYTPFFGFLLSVLPKKRPTAFYLRPFANDDRTLHWRTAISRAIDPGMRFPVFDRRGSARRSSSAMQTRSRSFFVMRPLVT